MSSDKKPLTSEELDRKIKEVQLQTEELRRETEEMQRENEELRRKNEEGQRELQASQQKTRKMIEENAKMVTQLHQSIREANGNFNNKWGRFMQSLVKGDLITLLNLRGIEVDHTFRSLKMKRKDKSVRREYDLIAANGQEVVVVEVKTMLTSDDVDDFLNSLADFKAFNSSYKAKTIYGAMAYLDQEGAAAYAQKSGLFTIEALGASEVATITNPESFAPKVF